MSLQPTNKRLRSPSNEEGPSQLKKSHTLLKSESFIIGKLYSLIENIDHEIIPNRLITVGRSRACDIILKYPDISTKHCEVIPVYNEMIKRYYLNLVDKSSNGTFVNGVRITNTNYLLKNGDKVNFAKSSSYVFRYKESEKAEDNKENITDGDDFQSKRFSDEYVIGKQLGSGHYATVNEAISRSTGKTFAVKIFKPTKIDDKKSAKQFNQETNVLLSIKHENIVELIDTFIEPVNKFTITTYLVLEKINNGELFTRIVEKERLRENETKAVFKQLLNGLKYLHDRNIIHRDIKPENILLNITLRTSPDQLQTGPWDSHELDVRVKIADFGLAKFIGELKFTNTLCGTPAYVAPEVLTSSSRKYSKQIDLWSSGVLLYVCLSGFPPFNDELGPPSMREQILQAKYAFYSPYFDSIDDSALDLIARLLVKEPENRWDIDQTIGHRWFKDISENDQDNDVKMTRSPLKGNAPRSYTELSKMDQD